jgi:hypothetical protein
MQPRHVLHADGWTPKRLNLEVRIVLWLVWLSSKVGSDDLVTIGTFPADIVDAETWTLPLMCGPLDLEDRNNPNHARCGENSAFDGAYGAFSVV